MSEFYDLCRRFGTDKGPGHRYDAAYASVLAPLRDSAVRLLEIGVKDGASLRVWEAYLPKAEIFGMDCDPATQKHASARSRVFIGDQADSDFLNRVVGETGGRFDIVVDDGGHEMHQQQISFEVLWPHVSPGGVYVIEDIHSSFLARYNPTQQTTTFDWLIRQARAGAVAKVRQAPSWGFLFYGAACFVFKTDPKGRLLDQPQARSPVPASQDC